MLKIRESWSVLLRKSKFSKFKDPSSELLLDLYEKHFDEYSLEKP